MSIKSGILKLRNTTGHDLVVALEPWGDEHPLAAGATMEVAYMGPASGDPEIEVSRGRISVYGWTGSTLEVRVPTTPSTVSRP